METKMTDSMIERIARIICANRGGEPDAIIDGEGAAWGKSWAGWQAYASEAKEIIAAMREPTDAMLAMVNAEAPAFSRDLTGQRWRAMIDAALVRDGQQ